MSDEPAVKFLRGVVTRMRSQSWERDHFDASNLRAAREDALKRYSTILAPELVGAVDWGTLVGLLRDMKKHHTMGLGRGVPKTADPTRLREALVVLVDERLPLKDRLERLRPAGGQVMVKGLGPSVITSILHMINPERYGILNATSESVLRRLGVYPELPASASFAVRYEAVNQVLLRLASALGVDLGLLDYLFWRVQPQALSDFAATQTRDR